jgi:hypothetical protein
VVEVLAKAVVKGVVKAMAKSVTEDAVAANAWRP